MSKKSGNDHESQRQIVDPFSQVYNIYLNEIT